MRYQFILNDEKTVTNPTVKVTVQATGPADAPREELETRVQDALSAFLPDVTWIFGGFGVSSNAGFPIYTVLASARINAELNDNLEERAANYRGKGASLRLYDIDQSIPLHIIREAEQTMRLNILKLANIELDRLSNEASGLPAGTLPKLHIEQLDFSIQRSSPYRNAKDPSSYSTANSMAPAAAGGIGAIGYSEKIYSSAVVLISDNTDAATYKIVKS